MNADVTLDLDKNISQVEQQSLLNKPNNNVKKVIKDVAAAMETSAAGIALMISQPQGSLLQFAGSDVVVSSLKNMMKKIPGANAKMLSFPALITLIVISYLMDPTRLSTNIFGGLLAKDLSKSVKDLMKGQPFTEAATEGLPVRS